MPRVRTHKDSTAAVATKAAKVGATAARKSAERRGARAGRKFAKRHAKTAEAKLEAVCLPLLRKHRWADPKAPVRALRPLFVLEFAQERFEIAKAILANAAAELADCDRYRGSASTRSGRETRSATKKVRAFLAAEVRSAQRGVAAAEKSVDAEIARLRHAGRLPMY